MTKILLAALTWAVLLCGEGGAADPRAQAAQTTGLLTHSVNAARKVVYAIAGRMLGSLIVEGMSQERVRQILGRPSDTIGLGDVEAFRYHELGLCIIFQGDVNAAGGYYPRVIKVTCD